MKKAALILLAVLMFIDTEVFAITGYTFNVIVALEAVSLRTQDDYDGLWHNKDFTINLTATDTRSGIKDTYYRINNGATLVLSTAGQPLITNEGGNNMLEYWSVNKSGEEELPHNILADIKLDKTMPVIRITSPANEAAFNEGPITITGIVTDAISGNSFSINVEGTFYTPVIGKDGNFTVTGVALAGGPNKINISAVDMAGNTANSSISVFLGWILHLQVPYHPIADYYSGAASAQMILNYMRNGVKDDLTQEEIYNYAHQYNDPQNLSLLEMDPVAMYHVLGHFDPYDLMDPTGAGDAGKGYNFDVESFAGDKFTSYLRDIVHWMAYPVTIGCWWKDGDLAKWPNTPPAIPAYGTYNHWIIVNGAATTGNPAPLPRTNPRYTPNFTVYGLWLTDPALDGIGQDLYITAQAAQETFFLPVSTGDSYNGKYIQVAEPPEVESDAMVQAAEPKINEETMAIIQISEEIAKEIPDIISDSERRVENARKHLYDAALVVDLKNDAQSWFVDQDKASLNSVFNPIGQSYFKLDWKKIVDSSLLTDEGFVSAFDGSQARIFVKVRRADKENSFYYLIPFDKYVNGRFLTYAAIIVDAKDGSFKEASWVKEPARFIQITKSRATQLVLSVNPVLQNADIKAELIWKPGCLSQSPFYPYWKIASGGTVYFVAQNGEVIKEDE